MIDVNKVIRAYLLTKQPLITLVGDRIYHPRLPERAQLPALSFLGRGGSSTPYIPEYISPSIQFDCWGRSQKEAREVYRLLYDALQGIQNEKVIIGADSFVILSASEEVQGQDLMDDIPNYYRVLSFFEIQF